MQPNDDVTTSEAGEESLQSSIQASRMFSQRLKELLPLFTKNLDLLESGIFISSYGHPAAYKEISRHQDAYFTLIEMIGHELIHHASGFFYLAPQDMQVLSKREKQAAACIFALIEYMSDMGFSIENMILSEEPIKQTDLERLYEQFAERFEKIGLSSQESFISEGLKKLVESGVMTEQESANGTHYCLALPVYFYLDIARKVNHDKQSEDMLAQDVLLDEWADASLAQQAASAIEENADAGESTDLERE
jgi:hypothetical protein